MKFYRYIGNFILYAESEVNLKMEIKMSVSIYYSAERKNPLSADENKKIGEVIEEYSNSYPYKDTEEDLYVYEYDKSEPEVVFRGSTKLPLSDNIEETIIAVTHWAACLSDIRRIVSDAQWEVNMDDTYLLWDDIDGWQLPTD